MRKLGNKVWNGCKWLLDFSYWVVLAILLDVLIIGAGGLTYYTQFSQDAQEQKIRDIYQQIIIATGQSQDALPLVIDESPIENAYNDGTKVVIYRGLINHTRTWDEIAMVLGHEVAHGMLWHLKMPLVELTDDEVSVLEANADKMGAFYMIKAGYNICEGRQLFKYWKEQNGNALGQNHPDYSYRYDELNVGCSKE